MHKTIFKTSRENIIKKLPRVKSPGKGKNTIVDGWKIFFPAETISQILNYTNN